MTRTEPGPEPEPAPFTKIAVTVPTEIFAVVEQMRRRLGKSRSSVVSSALEGWIRSARRAEADRRYVEGYLRTPESVDEIAAVAAQATSHWNTWAPEAPSRASEPGPTEPWGMGSQSAREPGTPRTPRAPRAPRTPRSGTRKRTRR